MKATQSYKLVVESERNDSIEQAYKKAAELFVQISKIKSELGNFAFIVAPDERGHLSEYPLLEGVAQQVFIDWCDSKNNQAGYSIYKVKLVKY